MNKATKKKIIRQKEQEDIQGISRQKQKFRLTLKELYGCKITMIILIVLFYFIYSPALIFLMLLYALLFFLSIATEKSINKSFLKKNKLKIPKFDHAVAVIVILIAVVAGVNGETSQTKEGIFENFEDVQISSYIRNNGIEVIKEKAQKSQTEQTIKDIFSLMTGERSIFSSNPDSMSNFGFEKAPEGFTPPEGFSPSNGFSMPSENFSFDFENSDFDNTERPELPEDFDFESFRKNNMSLRSSDIQLSDMPIYYLFSSILSIIASVLVFLVPLLSILQMVYTSLKKKKIETQTFSSVEISTSFTLSDELLEKLLPSEEDIVLDSDFEIQA